MGSRPGGSTSSLVVAIAVSAALTAAGVFAFRSLSSHPPKAGVIATRPATSATTVAATTPATAATEPSTYVEVLRATYPKLSATRPLGVPVDLPDAGHFVVPGGVYLDPTGALWATRPGAPPAEQVLRELDPGKGYDQPRLTRDCVVFAWPAPDPTDRRKRVKPRLVVRAPGAGGGFEWVGPFGRHRVAPARAFRWNLAKLWNGRIVVPTDTGVSVFVPDVASARTTEPALEAFHSLVSEGGGTRPAAPYADVQFAADARGMLAWVPWDPGRTGGRGAARYVDDAWVDLKPDAGWPAAPVQLVPLVDGSVLRIGCGNRDDRVALSIAPLEAAGLDETEVMKLVALLSDPDRKTRDAATAELSRSGPSVWPLLEAAAPKQSPEGRFRIKMVLRDRVKPTLGGMTVVDDRATVAARLADGGVLLAAPWGVEVPRLGQPPEVVKPGWLVVRPGSAVTLAAESLVRDAEPGRQAFFAAGDDWVVSDAEHGPQRWLGNHLEPMLRPPERAFRTLVGVDARGRWVFRQPATPAGDGPTLVLDPTLPDPTPRLRVWLVSVGAGGRAGWDGAGRPAIERGGAWSLREAGWTLLDPAKDKVIVAMPPVTRPSVPPDAIPPRPSTPPDDFFPMPSAAPGPAPAPTSSAPNAVPASAPAARSAPPTSLATTVTIRPDVGPVLATSPDGTQFFGGRDALVVRRGNDDDIRWPLPPEAAGSPEVEPRGVCLPDGTLFLWNAPGRLARIRPAATGAGAPPFEVEAVFKHRLPAVADPARIWLDPAGRLCIAYEGDRLAICFPSGQVPRPIADLMPAEQLRDQEE